MVGGRARNSVSRPREAVLRGRSRYFKTNGWTTWAAKNRFSWRIPKSDQESQFCDLDDASGPEYGLFLGMTSQCIDGRVRMTVYESGRDLLELGIVPLENMIPEVALVKTMWALGNSEDNNGLKKLLLENISSEFS